MNKQTIEKTGDPLAGWLSLISSKLAFRLLRPFCPNAAIQFYYI